MAKTCRAVAGKGFPIPPFKVIFSPPLPLSRNIGERAKKVACSVSRVSNVALAMPPS